MVTVRESEGEQGFPVCTCDSSTGKAEAGGSTVSVDKLLFHVRVREALSLCLKSPHLCPCSKFACFCKTKIKKLFCLQVFEGIIVLA